MGDEQEEQIERRQNDQRLRELEVSFAKHEAICAGRNVGIEHQIEYLTKGLDDIKTLMIRIGVGIAFGMASILASIAFKQ